MKNDFLRERRLQKSIISLYTGIGIALEQVGVFGVLKKANWCNKNLSTFKKVFSIRFIKTSQ